jgi:hypothetical protein
VPIVNCFLRDDEPPRPETARLTTLWSEESDIGAEHMTINMIAGARQIGAPYRVMAVLYLPSLWSSESVRQLQEGLARALSRGFAVAAGEVQVITSVVESGHVVEGGETQYW